MFCPNCGTQLPDGSAFCANCGNPLPQVKADPVYAEPAVPVYAEPVYAEPAAPVYAAPAPAYNPYATQIVAQNKSVWLSTLASPKAKKLGKLSPILTVACALVLIFALCAAYLGPFYNIPVFKLSIGESGVSEFKELQREALDADEELDNLMRSMGVSMNKLLNNDKAEEIYDACVALIKNPSLSNMRKFVVVAEEEALVAYDTIISFLWISFGIVALLAVLGGLLKKTGLVIAAMVVSVPVNLLFGGFVFLILTLAALGILSWALMQISREYKAYKKNPGNTYAY